MGLQAVSPSLELDHCKDVSMPRVETYMLRTSPSPLLVHYAVTTLPTTNGLSRLDFVFSTAVCESVSVQA